MLHTATATYVLAETPEDNIDAVARKNRWDKVKNTANMWRNLGIAGIAVGGGLSVWLFVIALIQYCAEGNNYNLAAMWFLAVFVTAGCVFSSKLFEANKNRFLIDVTNYNDEYFQFRILQDNRLYIIGGANFDEQGNTIRMNFVTEMEPIYSDLMIMESISSIKSYAEGAVIKGVATFRTYRINKGLRTYIQLEKKQNMVIFLQRGLYPEEMLEKVAETYNVRY